MRAYIPGKISYVKAHSYIEQINSYKINELSYLTNKFYPDQPIYKTLVDYP